MNRPIAFREFDEDEYREIIQTVSEEEPIKAGKRLRQLSGDEVSTVPGVFDEQLKICREFNVPMS